MTRGASRRPASGVPSPGNRRDLASGISIWVTASLGPGIWRDPADLHVTRSLGSLRVVIFYARYRSCTTFTYVFIAHRISSLVTHIRT